MSFETGTVTNASGSYALAHQNLLELIEDKLTSTAFMGAGNEWVTELYTASGDHELIMRGPGLSGTQEVYIGWKLYHDVATDYYNTKTGAFTGYVSGNAFDSQPGANVLARPLHNTSITYWLVANAQRVILITKQSAIFAQSYQGLFLPYASPSQYPLPIINAGTLTSASATRYSDTTNNTLPFKGTRNNLRMRFNDGVWKTPDAYPWFAVTLATTNALQIRNTNSDSATATGYYAPLPVVLCDTTPNIYGELDGVYHVSGYNVVAEDVVSISSVDYLIIPESNKSGFNDYCAIKLA